MSTFLKGLSVVVVVVVSKVVDVVDTRHGFSRWFHGFSWFLVGFHGFSR